MAGEAPGPEEAQAAKKENEAAQAAIPDKVRRRAGRRAASLARRRSPPPSPAHDAAAPPTWPAAVQRSWVPSPIILLSVSSRSKQQQCPERPALAVGCRRCAEAPAPSAATHDSAHQPICPRRCKWAAARCT